jgi:ubiquinone/menaquinone biosynthesis C-methylase UbiE
LTPGAVTIRLALSMPCHVRNVSAVHNSAAPRLVVSDQRRAQPRAWPSTSRRSAIMTSNLTLKDEIAAYWSTRAAGFDASPGHAISPGRERAAWLRLLADRLGPLQDRQVLELASGTGEFTGLLLETGAWVTGLDLSDAMLARARHKLAGAHRRLSLFLGDAEDTREPANRYDAVVCRHLAWTLPEPRRAVTEWFRVLRPGGRLMVVDGDWVRLPLIGRVRRAIGRGLTWAMCHQAEAIDRAGHDRIMARVHFRDGLRPAPLAAMLRDAGFTDIQNGPIATIRRHQRRAARFPHALMLGAATDFWLTAAKPRDADRCRPSMDPA